MEQWVEVDGFSNYEVSNKGRVRNKTTRQFLKPLDNGRGTLMVVLRRAGGSSSQSLRRVVANAFDPMGDREDLSPIHLDCDYKNCEADNLEWRPRRFAYEWTRQSKREPINSGRIVDIETLDVWESAWHAARDLKTTERIVLNVVRITDRFGEHIGSYKGRQLRYVHDFE